MQEHFQRKNPRNLDVEHPYRRERALPVQFAISGLEDRLGFITLCCMMNLVDSVYVHLAMCITLVLYCFLFSFKKLFEGHAGRENFKNEIAHATLLSNVK